MFFKVYFLFVWLYCTQIGVHVCDSESTYKGIEFGFYPQALKQIVERETHRINITISNENQTEQSGNISFKAAIEETYVARLKGNDTFSIQGLMQNGNYSPSILFETVEVEAWSLGFAKVKFYAKVIEDGQQYSEPVDWEDTGISYDISVVRRRRAVDDSFLYIIYSVVLLVNVTLGCKIDVSVIKAIFKKPIAPIIALVCQFVYMPLICFGIIKLLKLKGSIALGLFAVGCAPGGGNSNMYCHLLDGNLSLSVTLTTCSIFMSLGFTTMWLLTLGQVILADEGRVRIPFQNIILSLFIVLIPVSIGFLIKMKKPNWAAKISKFLKLLFILLLLLTSTIGLYSNLFVFRFFTPEVILAGCLLPYSGFFVGGFITWLCRQPYPNVVAVAIETGVQNAGLAVVMLHLSLPYPESDLAMVGPVVFLIFSPIVLWIAIIIYNIKNKCFPTSAGVEAIAEHEKNGDVVNDNKTLPSEKNKTETTSDGKDTAEEIKKSDEKDEEKETFADKMVIGETETCYL